MMDPYGSQHTAPPHPAMAAGGAGWMVGAPPGSYPPAVGHFTPSVGTFPSLSAPGYMLPVACAAPRFGVLGDGRGTSRSRSRRKDRGGKGRPGTRTSFSSQMQKTKMCDFHRDGRCKYGSECSFAHDEEELKGVPDLRKTRMCRAFTQGKCNDVECKFAHGNVELRKVDLAKENDNASSICETAEGAVGGGDTGLPVVPAPNAKLKKARRRGGRASRRRPRAEGESDQGDGNGDDNSSDDGDAASGQCEVNEVTQGRASKSPERGHTRSCSNCQRCGSSIARHLGYDVCAVCRV